MSNEAFRLLFAHVVVMDLPPTHLIADPNLVPFDQQGDAGVASPRMRLDRIG